MSCPLVPSYRAESIYRLTPAGLKAREIKLVLADLDNTLTPYEEALPSPGLRAWKEELEQNGITLFVVSNSRKSRRCPDFCEALGIGYVRHAGKPSTKGFAEALAQTGIPAHAAIMVGDQIFTDTLGASNAGVVPMLVEPIRLAGNPGR